MLFLVATPIGNLGDITLRALEHLKSCDYILCEDTRHSLKLLKHYEIQKHLKSYHKFSEAKNEEGIIADLKSGKQIVLISDAGTPGISDPGTRLVKRCIKEGLKVTALPGACAAITALVCSGLDTERFEFMGFLPKTEGRLRRILEEILESPSTTICYESALRVHKVLKIIAELDPDRQIVIGRELTKKFEEFRRGTAKELQGQSFKGEVVLLIGSRL